MLDYLLVMKYRNTKLALKYVVCSVCCGELGEKGLWQMDKSKQKNK